MMFEANIVDTFLYIYISSLQLYVQVDIIACGLFGSFTNFANRYCEAFMESIHGAKFVYKKWNTR